jgi:hypothetical protein
MIPSQARHSLSEGELLLNNKGSPGRPHSRILIVIILLGLASTCSGLTARSVHAAYIGTLSIDPPNVPQGNPTELVTLTVRVDGMDYLNGWDIEILTDPTALNATSLTVAPNLFTGAPYEVAHCINGIQSDLGVCSRAPGIVHSAVVYTGASLPQPPVYGVLFTITYRAGNNGFTNIHFVTNTLKYGSTDVAQTPPSDGVYGTPPAPDFTISTSNSPLTIPPNSRANATITLSSQNQFSGRVNLTATVSPPGILVNLNPSYVRLNNNSMKTNATISTAGSTPGYHSVTITAVGASGPHTLQIDVTVKTNPDFSTQALPNPLKIFPLTSGSTTLTLTSENGLAGNIDLILQIPQIPRGVNATLSSSRLYLSAGGTNSSTLTVGVPLSPSYYNYLINITETSATISHVQTVLVIPPPQDLAISANPTLLTAHPGGSVLTTISVSSALYFVGVAYMQASMQDGTAKLNSTNAYLDVGKTTFARLNITLDPNITPGSYVALLTIYSVGTPNQAQVTHTLGLTISVTALLHTSTHTAPATIFGLAPIVYFGILGMASVVWGVLSIQSYRKSRE